MFGRAALGLAVLSVVGHVGGSAGTAPAGKLVGDGRALVLGRSLHHTARKAGSVRRGGNLERKGGREGCKSV